MSAPIDLNWVRAFVAVHETGSFSTAATRLGVPRSTVSRAVAALEESLRLSLFQRTTRRVTTTPEGKALFDRAAPSLSSLEASFADVPERSEGPTGTLRVTATIDIGSIVLAETATRFTARYPRATVDVHLSNSLVDLVAENFDLALRITLGTPRGTGIVSRKVGTLTIQLYASPSYLARRGTPRSPDDLRDHDAVVFRAAPPMQLKAANATSLSRGRTRVICDDVFFTREVLRTGGGIGTLPTFVADADVASGALVRVLPRWIAHTGTVFLVRPARKHVPERVSAFRDVLLETLRQRPLSASSPAEP